MPTEAAHARPDYQAFGEICSSAVNCNHCFAAGYVKRAYIDIAQPRYIGPNYWTAAKRMLFLSINPGAGKGSPSDQRMRNEIYEYRAGKLELSVLFLRQRGYMQEWGKNGQFLKYFNAIGCDLQDVALLNVAWCASMNNDYPPQMLSACFSRHTHTAIETLRPTSIIACGGEAQRYARNVQLPFIGVPHYAAWGSVDYAGIRRSLGLQAAAVLASDPLGATPVACAPCQSRYTRTNVIHLQQLSNPKTGKSALRYGCYRDGITVSDYEEAVRERLGDIEARKCKADLKWDVQHSFIRIERI